MSQVNLNLVEQRNAKDALESLIGRDLPIRLAMKFTRIHAALLPRIEQADKIRQEIVDKYLKRDDAGNPIPKVGKDGEPIPNAYEVEDSPEFRERSQEYDEAAREVIPVEVQGLVTIQDLETVFRDKEKEDAEVLVPGATVYLLGPLLSDE